MEKLQFPVRKEFPYDRIGSWHDGNPFTITYVYPQSEPPFIIKGGYHDVKAWLKSYNKPCVCYRSMWYRGTERGVWDDNLKTFNKNISLYINPQYKKRTKEDSYGEYRTGKYIMSIYKDCELVLKKTIRRIPRSWIKELDAFI